MVIGIIHFKDGLIGYFRSYLLSALTRLVARTWPVMVTVFVICIIACVRGVLSLQQADVLVVAGTTNDVIRWHTPDGQLEMSVTMREEYWRRLLGTALKNIPAVFVMGTLPIDEKMCPYIGTNDWKYWTNKQDIVDYDAQIAEVCAGMKIPFFDPVPACDRKDWASMLHDGDHPNAAGHEFLAELAYGFLKDKI